MAIVSCIRGGHQQRFGSNLACGIFAPNFSAKPFVQKYCSASVAISNFSMKTLALL
jgi:hypothetical protein